MKKKYILILLTILVLIIFFIPFFLEKGTNEKIASGTSLIAGFSSLLTLIIALFLFNKFGIETSILEKQTKQVFELLEVLNKQEILIEGKFVMMKFNPAKPNSDFYKNYSDKKLVFSSKYMEGLQNIWGFSENIFLPKEIADKLRKLPIYMLSNIKEDINEDELKVSLMIKGEMLEKLGKGNDKEMKMSDFVKNWSELIEEIKNWISDNSSIKSELNL